MSPKRSKGVQRSTKFGVHGSKPDVVSAVNAMGRCPKGHVLPHRTNRGVCTPVYCAGSDAGDPAKGNGQVARQKKDDRFTQMSALGNATRKKRQEVVAILSKEADKVIDLMIPDTVPGYEQAREAAKMQKGEEIVKLAHAIGRWSAMKTFFRVPEGLTGAAAEDFVASRSLDLSVDALVELERQLKLGDDSQRRDAARDILDMTGMRRKEGVQATAPTIMIINQGPGAGPIAVPWERKTNIVEGKYVPQTTTAVDANSPLASLGEGKKP